MHHRRDFFRRCFRRGGIDFGRDGGHLDRVLEGRAAAPGQDRHFTTIGWAGADEMAFPT